MGLFNKKEEVTEQVTENAEIEEVQTTFNEDGIDILVEEGEVENVSNEDE